MSAVDASGYRWSYAQYDRRFLFTRRNGWSPHSNLGGIFEPFESKLKYKVQMHLSYLIFSCRAQKTFKFQTANSKGEAAQHQQVASNFAKMSILEDFLRIK